MLWRSLLLILMVASAIVLVLAGFERGLRHFTGESAGPIKYTQHPTALATMVPNLEKKHRGWRGKHYYRTNANGVRHDGPMCKDADVLLFGDSNVFARFLPYEETLGRQVENLFENDICAINFGVPGYGPDQSLLRMQYEIEHLDLAPKVIVFHVFADNDFGDLFRNYLFVVDGTGDLQHTGRDPVDYKLRTMERLQAQYLLVRRVRDLMINTGFYQMPALQYVPEREGSVLMQAPTGSAELLHYIEKFEDVTRSEFEQYKKGRYTTWLGDLYDYHLAMNPGSEAAQKARQLLAAILGEAKRTSEALGACFVALIQPSELDASEMAPITYRDLKKYSDTRRRDYRRRNLVDIATAAAIDSGVAYIDLFDIYTGSDSEPYTDYKDDGADNHWNAEGVRLAAEAVSGFIRDNDCLATPDPSSGGQ